MSPIILNVVFGLFAAYVIYLVVKAVIQAVTPDKKPEPFFKPVAPYAHEHEWRHVTEFVKQCRIRTCSAVQFDGEVPDGLRDYINLMTSRQARTDPKGEASHYHELDSRAWGMKCPHCDRVIGSPEDLPQSPFVPVLKDSSCPFCQQSLRMSHQEGTGLTYEKNQKTVL